MKKIIFILSALAILSGCSKSDNGNDDKYLKEIRITENIYEYGKPASTDKLYESYVYDAQGNLIQKEENHYNILADSRIYNIYKYKYDSNNKLIESNNDEAISGTYRIEYTYNAIDSISEEKKYDKDGLRMTTKNTYDNNKKLIRKDEIDEVLLSYYKLYFYKDGLVSKIESYESKDNTLFYNYFYEYDSKNNLTKQTNVSPSGSSQTVFSASYKYNANGTISEKTIVGLYQSDSETHTYTYIDDKINTIHVSFSNKNKAERDLKYTYKYE